MKKIVSTAVGCMAFMAVSASAATFSLVGGTANAPLPATWNDGISGIPDVGSLVTTFNAAQSANGDGVYLSGIADIQYEFLGSAAANANTLSSGLNLLFSSDSSTKGALAITDNQPTGLVDFTYWTDSLVSGGIPGSYTNGMGSTLNTLALAVYFESNTSLILLFNDGNSDADYDDLLVRATSISAIPLPAAFWLFGSGLVGLFGMRKRAKKA